MPAAARATDVTATGAVIIGPGVPTVLIGNLPAAVLGDVCSPPPGTTFPPSPITTGSTTVLIGGKPAARALADVNAYGDSAALGDPTVQIG